MNNTENTSKIKLDSIQDAIEDIRNGKMIIVVDDEDRENEGDFIAAAEKVTPEMINFMAQHGRGLICAPLIEDRCNELGLNMMVSNNTVLHNTQFTVSDIYIYNRFGILLYKIDAISIGWDGTYKGKKLPSNSYWFKTILTDINGYSVEKKGSFSLIRN